MDGRDVSERLTDAGGGWAARHAVLVRRGRRLWVAWFVGLAAGTAAAGAVDPAGLRGGAVDALSAAAVLAAVAQQDADLAGLLAGVRRGPGHGPADRAAVDHLLLAAAGGVGFQYVEDAIRRLVVRPSLLTILLGGDNTSTQYRAVSLFPGWFQSIGGERFAGHAVTSR